jgi:hypothetical protein
MSTVGFEPTITVGKADLPAQIKLRALYGAETWTFRAVDQKHLKSFEMCCWRKMEKDGEDQLDRSCEK